MIRISEAGLKNLDSYNKKACISRQNSVPGGGVVGGVNSNNRGKPNQMLSLG